MANESRRKGGFTRVPDGLPGILSAKKCSGQEWAVLMELMRYQNTDGTFWRPRADVAQSLGTSEGIISNRVASLKRKGIIEQVGGGHPGTPAIYHLTD